MKKKIFLFIFLFLSFFIFSVNFSFAKVSEKKILPPPEDGMRPQFLGQNHYYTVTFRGNGEAVVNVKVILSNLNEEPLSTVSLRIPRVEAKDIAVYQVIREKQCISWESPIEIQKEIPFQQESQIYPSIKRPSTKCQQYQEPDYYQPWWGQQKYQKARYELKTDTIVISLPSPIKKDKSGSFIVYYRALGYAKKNLFGAFNFTFETAKVEEKIQNLQVGITTDSDLHLRGAKGKVSYRLETAELPALKASSTGEFANARFDSFYQQIGDGAIIKNASNLQPLDSYTVSGSYADSLLKLYGKEILIGVGGVILLFLVAVILAKVISSRIKKTAFEKKEENFIWVLIAAGLSFICAFLIIGYSLFIFWLLQYFNSYYYQLAPLLIILILLMSLGVYLILVFTPAIFIAIKKSLAWGVVTFVLTVFWLIFFSVVSFFILFFLNQYELPLPFYPQSLMENSVNGGASK